MFKPSSDKAGGQRGGASIATQTVSIEEIMERLSELLIRVEGIENSLPYSNDSGLAERLTDLEDKVSLLKQPQLTAGQNDTINQIKAERIHLVRKVDEALARKRGKREGEYTSIKEEPASIATKATKAT